MQHTGDRAWMTSNRRARLPLELFVKPEGPDPYRAVRHCARMRGYASARGDRTPRVYRFHVSVLGEDRRPLQRYVDGPEGQRAQNDQSGADDGEGGDAMEGMDVQSTTSDESSRVSNATVMSEELLPAPSGRQSSQSGQVEVKPYKITL